MTEKPAVAPVLYLDVPTAPEFFADETAGFFIHNGNISLTFVAARCNHETSPGPVNRVVVSRMVLPIATAQVLVLGLGDFLKSQNLDATEAIKGGATMN